MRGHGKQRLPTSRKVERPAGSGATGRRRAPPPAAEGTSRGTPRRDEIKARAGTEQNASRQRAVSPTWMDGSIRDFARTWAREARTVLPIEVVSRCTVPPLATPRSQDRARRAHWREGRRRGTRAIPTEPRLVLPTPLVGGEGGAGGPGPMWPSWAGSPRR